MWPIALQSCTWVKSSNCRIAMNSMPLRSIPIRRLCFQRYLSLTHRLRSAASASFFLAICQVQLTFHLVVAFIHAAQWHKISAARWNLPMKQKKGESTTLHATSLNMSHQLINANLKGG